jgi:hypothetical protein
VHVVQSCHLDVGFADTCAGIVNRYFDKFYLNVIETSANLTEADPDGPQLTVRAARGRLSALCDFIVDRVWMGLLCGRAGRITTQNGVFWPG